MASSCQTLQSMLGFIPARSNPISSQGERVALVQNSTSSIAQDTLSQSSLGFHPTPSWIDIKKNWNNRRS